MFLFINTVSSELPVLILAGLVRKRVKGRATGGKNYRILGSAQKLTAADRLLNKINGLNFNIRKLSGIIVLAAPGPFTAARIGITAANTLGFAQDIPTVGLSLEEAQNPREFVLQGIRKLQKAKRKKIVLPVYGKEPNITRPSFSLC